MNAPLNLVIEIINFIKSNSLNDRLFHQFCEDEEHQTLLMHTEVRWLSMDNTMDIDYMRYNIFHPSSKSFVFTQH